MRVVLQSPADKPIFMEVFKRTQNYIMTKLILQKQYNISIRVEKY